MAIVAAEASRLLRFRRPLIQAITTRGHKVLVLTGHAGAADLASLADLGVETASFSLGAEVLKAMGDRRGIAALAQALADWKPSVVLGIGLKPMVMAALAARGLADARVVLVAPSLAGLPRFTGRGPGFSTRWNVRRALRAAHVLVVHNRGIETALRAFDVLPAGLRVCLQFGAGVDLSHYAPQPMPPIDRGLVFAMITRRDPAKGVVEFCEAARRVATKAPGTRFVLATYPTRELAGGGGFDAKPLPAGVEVSDAPGDVRALMAAAHVFVLPSHAEGFAQEVVEALACGRPAIVSNIPGCCEIVDERVSGVLVPPRDSLALAAAMESFLRRPDQLAWMGQASRRKAERRFDANAAALELLDIMELGNRV